MCILRSVFVFSCVLVMPALVYAQASITGTVHDTSGAVLPGVTVEAASPALIERVRTTVTDSNGQYRIVDLRPGTYTVTFRLSGFAVVVREGIELTGTFVAPVNAELRVGGLEETITVSGETPVVDVQSATGRSSISGEVISEISQRPAVPQHRGARARRCHLRSARRRRRRRTRLQALQHPRRPRQ